jgi:hypothetical protein
MLKLVKRSDWLARSVIARNAAGDEFVMGRDSVGSVTALKPAGGSWRPLRDGEVFGSMRGWDRISDVAERLKLFTEAAAAMRTGATEDATR